jgi:manganese/zinc/iron transport system substrate-binding protein
MDEENATHYRERAVAYGAMLVDLDTEVRESLAVIPPEFRVLITSHDAFGYFGRAYGFDVRGLQGISTATEAGTGDVQELAAFVAERRIPAMFVESSISPRGIEAVREAVRDRGFEVRIGGTLYGDALGPAGSPADTYIGMVRTNVSTIIAGLHE